MSRAALTAASTRHAGLITELLRHGYDVSSPSPPRLDPANPVYNFLISYYGLRGAKGVRRLSRYSPGMNVVMEGVSADDVPSQLSLKHLRFVGGGAGGAYYTAEALDSTAQLRWNRNLMEATQKRAPITNCFGLHEWAMIYGNDTASPAPSADYQKGLELRIPQSVVDRTVDSSNLRCSHLDALRMFSEKAKDEQANEFGRIEEVRLQRAKRVAWEVVFSTLEKVAELEAAMFRTEVSALHSSTP